MHLAVVYYSRPGTYDEVEQEGDPLNMLKATLASTQVYGNNSREKKLCVCESWW
jgi:hypothetical protein